MKELKPCPFCGSEAEITDHGGFFTVGCTNLGCAVTIDLLEPSEEAAAADWNRRAAPENKPLTLDELRGMDGEPVWIVEAPDWGHWELSEHAEDYLDDRDPDFYGMKHDDPAGRYGLHVLGWLSYARRPEGSEING